VLHRPARGGLGGRVAVLATGTGVEEYVDPGTGTDKVIRYAPMEAVKDCLRGAASALPYDHIQINLAAEDLISSEIFAAVKHLVLALDNAL